MMAKDNFNCDVQNTEERSALQRIGFGKLHMMIHKHTPTSLTPAKEDEKKLLWSQLTADWKRAFYLPDNVALSPPQRSALMGIESASLYKQPFCQCLLSFSA